MNKRKLNRTEKGITLVALIITIIVLVILAAVSVSAFYNSKIIQYAINGSADYTIAGINENRVIKGTENTIENAVDRIEDLLSIATDENVPEMAEITLSGDEDAIQVNAIKVIGIGKDSGSGIGSIKFEQSLDGETWIDSIDGIYTYTDGETVKIQEHTYTGLEKGTTYYFRITVTDRTDKSYTTPKENYLVEKTMQPVAGLALSPTEAELIIGVTTLTLVPTVQPIDATNQKVIYTSANEEVATVDENGNITAKKNGTVVITVRTEDGGYEMKCIVTVKTATTGVQLNKTTMNLVIGGTSEETLVATILPEEASNKGVTWSSNHPEIAKVDDNGKVTAVANGTATITVRTADGDYKAQCIVTVTTAVSSVTVSPNTLNLVIGETNSGTLTATVAPDTASNKDIKWSSSNNNIVEVNQNGVVTAKTAGTCKITATSKGDTSKKGECTVTVTKVWCSGTGYTCTGPFSEIIDCPYCENKIIHGSIRKCLSIHWSSNERTAVCSICGKLANGHPLYHNGNGCSSSGGLYYHICRDCPSKAIDNLPCPLIGYCKKCTNGKITQSKNCTHDKSVQHSYCIHGYTEGHYLD